MQKVESFKLDHTKVKTPYIRKCCVLDGAKEYDREALEKGLSLNIYGE